MPTQIVRVSHPILIPEKDKNGKVIAEKVAGKIIVKHKEVGQTVVDIAMDEAEAEKLGFEKPPKFKQKQVVHTDGNTYTVSVPVDEDGNEVTDARQDVDRTAEELAEKEAADAKARTDRFEKLVKAAKAIPTKKGQEPTIKKLVAESKLSKKDVQEWRKHLTETGQVLADIANSDDAGDLSPAADGDTPDATQGKTEGVAGADKQPGTNSDDAGGKE